MVAWYKHDIPAWMDGTEALDDGPYRAYHVICQLIYLNEGPIALNEHGIAGRCKQSIRTFRTSLKTLLDLGKLTVEDGRIDNSRAKKELENVAENRVNAGTGGKKSGEARRAANKPLKNNDTSEATLQQDRSLKTREEETREEKIQEPRAVALVDDGWPTDYREQFWAKFPNKVGKPKALAKLDACRKRGMTFDAIMAGLDRYVRTKPPDRAWLNPETFINQERWADEPAASQGTGSNGRRSVHDAARSLTLSLLEQLDEPEPGGLREPEGGGVVRLLPPR